MVPNLMSQPAGSQPVFHRSLGGSKEEVMYAIQIVKPFEAN